MACVAVRAATVAAYYYCSSAAAAVSRVPGVSCACVRARTRGHLLCARVWKCTRVYQCINTTATTAGTGSALPQRQIGASAQSRTRRRAHADVHTHTRHTPAHSAQHSATTRLPLQGAKHSRSQHYPVILLSAAAHVPDLRRVRGEPKPPDDAG